MRPVTMPETTLGPRRLRSSVAGWLDILWRLLPAWFGCLAIAAFAALGSPGDGRVEGLYLARLALAPLACAAWLAPWPGFGGLAAALAVAAAWVLPGGPPRAVTFTALLASALATAAAARWQRDSRISEGCLPLDATVPLALGAQFLLRGDLLLGDPGARGWFALLALPVAGALAVTWLSRRHGERALIAMAAVLVLGPGWNVAATAAIVALAAGDAISAEVSALGRLAAGLALVAPLLWNWRVGLLAMVGGALLATRQLRRAALVQALIVAGALLVFFWRPVARVDPAELAWLPLLVPAAIVAALAGHTLALAAIALAFAATLGDDAAAGLAAPVALAALAALRDPARERVARSWQLGWSAIVLLATLFFAPYPWLRAAPAADGLRTIGLEPAGLLRPGVWIPAGVVAVAVALASRPSARRWLGALGWAALAALATAFVVPLGAAPRSLLLGEVAVTAANSAPRFEVPPPASAVGPSSLTLDSALLDAADLVRGTAVAAVRVEYRDGTARTFDLRAGEDTAEWAAARGDLRRAGLAPAPAAWLSWVADDKPPFFGQRYRTRWSAASTSPIAAITVTRSPTLPARSILVLYRLAVAP